MRGRWWVAGVSGVLALVVALAVAVAVTAPRSAPYQSQAQSRSRAQPEPEPPGPVLLVPGYGGSEPGLTVLAGRIRATGRTAEVLTLPGRAHGDIRVQADTLDEYVRRARAAGAPSVDLVGFSAGGLVIRAWLRDHAGTAPVRRVVTLGSPHHGTNLVRVMPAGSACPVACQQMVPGSAFLAGLPTPVPTPPQWLALWTAQDRTVYPPESARLEGATNVELQSICPAVVVEHTGLPADPLVGALVLKAIAVAPLRAPTAADCVGS